MIFKMENGAAQELLTQFLLLSQNNSDNSDEIMEILMQSDSESSSSSDDEEVVHEKCKEFVELIDKFSEGDFKGHMRLKRTTVDYLIAKFQDVAAPSYDNLNGAGTAKTSAKKMIYIYVWYVSNTLTYRQLGNLFGISKSTAWVSVNRVANWLITIANEYIKWPTGSALERTREQFLQKSKIPGIIGALDCTHININAPTENKEGYYDRKQNYSIVLQAIVDADKKFIDVFCGEPGSLHDSRVLRRSGIFSEAESNYRSLFPCESFLLADSAYAPKSWLVPPFRDYGNLTNKQKQFNRLHSTGRIVVENAFGLLKGRFRRLLKFSEQRDIHIITNIVSSICVLHNISIIAGEEPIEDAEVENEANISEEVGEEEEIQPAEHPSQRRDALFRHLEQLRIIQ